MEYFTSDQHFNHSNIIKYCQRPFSSIEEMEKVLINNWNNLVKDNDIVYVLGDFALTSIQKIHYLCKELKGKKILIKGNHDRHSSKKYVEAGFLGVYPDFTVIHKNWKFFLTHRPPRFEIDSTQIIYKPKTFNIDHLGYIINDDTKTETYNLWNLCGHVHEKWKINQTLRTLNVGVDVWDFKPINYEEILKEIQTTP